MQAQKLAVATEQLRERIASLNAQKAPDPSSADAMMQLLIMGSSKSGKTYVLNQVLEDKLPKGCTVSVGVGGIVLRLGQFSVAVQVIDIPGDPRYAPLGTFFYAATPYVILMFDATSFESFEALQPLLDAFRRANPACDPAQHACVVANEARVGMKHAVSPGLALQWCEQNGDIPFFNIDPQAPQGILEALRCLADHALTQQGVAASGRHGGDSLWGTQSFGGRVLKGQARRHPLSRQASLQFPHPLSRQASLQIPHPLSRQASLGALN